VAATSRLAAEVGLVGCTIEDATGNQDSPLYDESLVFEGIAAAAEAARALRFPFILTVRAHNLLYATPSLGDTICRLQAFAKAGADVLSAPDLPDLTAVRSVCTAVSKVPRSGGDYGLVPRSAGDMERGDDHQPGTETLLRMAIESVQVDGTTFAAACTPSLDLSAAYLPLDRLPPALPFRTVACKARYFSGRYCTHVAQAYSATMRSKPALVTVPYADRPRSSSITSMEWEGKLGKEERVQSS
jgi:hypothetical protein